MDEFEGMRKQNATNELFQPPIISVSMATFAFDKSQIKNKQTTQKYKLLYIYIFAGVWES